MRQTMRLAILSSLATTASLASTAALGGALAGCHGAPVASTTAALTGDAGGGYQSQQGIWLHGTAAQRGTFTRSPLEGRHADLALAGATDRRGRRYDSLRIQHGQLQGTLGGAIVAGTALIGTRLHSRDGSYVVQIVDASKHINIYTGQDSGVWQYDATWAAASSPDQATRLCARHYTALAVPGSWQTGQLQRDDTVFSLACIATHGRQTCSNARPFLGPRAEVAAGARPPARIVDDSEPDALDAGCNGGVIAKCIDYGYAPWPDAPGLLRRSQLAEPFHVQNTREAAHQLHNLCVAAMRADYDGDDHAHTIEGTPIRLFDASDLSQAVAAGAGSLSSLRSLPEVAGKLPLQLGETHVGRLRMEALWATGDDGRAEAVCLEKRRWQTLDRTRAISCSQLLDLCLLQSPDHARRCEALHRPVLVSYSAHIDRPLYRFTAGDRSITTTHVIKGPDGRLAPDPETFCPGTYDRVEREGTILSPDLFRMFEIYKERDKLFSRLALLTSYREDGCRAVTTTEPLNRPSLPEGYVLGVEIKHARNSLHVEDLELFLWPTATGAVTAVREPAGALQGAFASRRFLGYVLQRDDEPSVRPQLLLQSATSE